MSQIFTKLSEIESQIDSEIKQTDKKIKEYQIQKKKLVALSKALKPKTIKSKKIVQNVGGKTDNQQNIS